MEALKEARDRYQHRFGRRIVTACLSENHAELNDTILSERRAREQERSRESRVEEMYGHNASFSESGHTVFAMALAESELVFATTKHVSGNE